MGPLACVVAQPVTGEFACTRVRRPTDDVTSLTSSVATRAVEWIFSGKPPFKSRVRQNFGAKWRQHIRPYLASSLG